MHANTHVLALPRNWPENTSNTPDALPRPPPPHILSLLGDLVSARGRAAAASVALPL